MANYSQKIQRSRKWLPRGQEEGTSFERGVEIAYQGTRHDVIIAGFAPQTFIEDPLIR
jgi:hypothetical protein